MSQNDPFQTLSRLEEVQLRVLNLLALGATLGEACHALDVSRATVTDWYVHNADFCEMFDRLTRVRTEAMGLLSASQKKWEAENLAPVANVSWYRHADYSRLRRMFSDGGQFPRTYAGWRKRAEQQLAEMTRGGWTIRKVYVDPDAFAAWCRRNGLEMNEEARMLHACYRASVEDASEAA